MRCPIVILCGLDYLTNMAVRLFVDIVRVWYIEMFHMLSYVDGIEMS